MSIAHDTISNIAQPTIAIGTGVALATPDHTTQILSVVTQVIALIILLFSKKKQA